MLATKIVVDSNRVPSLFSICAVGIVDFESYAHGKQMWLAKQYLL